KKLCMSFGRISRSCWLRNIRGEKKMKISKLVEHLQNVQKDYGDLNVATDLYREGICGFPDGVYIDKKFDNKVVDGEVIPIPYVRISDNYKEIESHVNKADTTSYVLIGGEQEGEEDNQ